MSGVAQFAFHALKTISETLVVKCVYWVGVRPRCGSVMSVVRKVRRVRSSLLMRVRDEVVRCCASLLRFRQRMVVWGCCWRREAVM